MSGGGAGIGRRGGKAATEPPDRVGGSWEYIRRPGAVYLWGRQLYAATSTAVGPSHATAPNVLRAYPQLFPRRGRIGRVGWFQGGDSVTGGAGAAIRFGIYSNHPTLCRPDRLLWDSGEFNTWPSPVVEVDEQWQYRSANLDVTTPTGPILLWVAFVYNTAFQSTSKSLYAWQQVESSVVMGYRDPSIVETGAAQYVAPVGGSVQAALTVGWRNPFPYAALPDPFPTDTLRLISSLIEPSEWSGFIPAVAYDWTDG